MILIDTGPIVVILNRNDPYHAAAVEAAARLPRRSQITTWPCLTEAMYLLGRATGMKGQGMLWTWLNTALFQVRDLSADEMHRMAELMQTYQDLPMDLADASLVATAEAMSERRIFTFDGHFRIDRLKDGSTLEVVP